MDEITDVLLRGHPSPAFENSAEFLRPPPDVTDLAKVLKTEENTDVKDFICRKGTTSDVFNVAKDTQVPSGDVGHQSNVTRIPATSQETASNLKTGDTYNLNYTEEEFIKEFKDDGEDEEQNYENDPRQVAEFDIIEREDGVTMEESAGTISAMEVFNPKKKKLWYVAKIKLLAEVDARAIDFDLDEKTGHFVMFSHKYKLRGHFPGPIIPETYKASFSTDRHVLEVAVKAVG